jgi:hypothetical protein
MQYELECGHCGYQFVLEAALPRTMTCAVCGGVLAIVVPVPLAPPPVSPKPLAPARAPARDERPRSKPRPPRFAEPWPAVCVWLGTARTATDLARILYAGFLFLDMCLFSFVPEAKGAEHGAIVRLLAMLGTALLVPTILHIGSQVVIAQTPRTHGGNLARASLGALVLAPVVGLAVSKHTAEGAIALAVLFVLVAAGVWVEFLARLGQSLGDDALADAARTFRVWLPFGLVGLASFLTLALVAARASSPPLVWFGRAATGVLGFVMLSHYAAVLRLAVDAVARRAPVEPG